MYVFYFLPISLTGCWFFIPTIFRQPSSGPTHTASGINLAKVRSTCVITGVKHNVTESFPFTHWGRLSCLLILKSIKIQEQLIDIQKQLAEKEARWKETLLKEIESLQVNSSTL